MPKPTWMLLILLAAVVRSSSSTAQTTVDAGHQIQGIVRSADGSVPFAAVSFERADGSVRHAVSDTAGRFRLESVADGLWTMSILAEGFQRVDQPVTVRHQDIELDITLRPDVLEMQEVVVTGTRGEVPLYESPVVVSRITAETMDETQSLSLSEGLAFSPGLRVENNCQNCGFTQLRMNGLDGAYSQILINGRPVFSALTGVYGLDLLPTNMIDRVEVVRGGGSSLYGGNAIAGTVNIITRRPTSNGFEMGINQGFIDMEIPDRVLSFNASIVAPDRTKGLSLYGFNRMRNEWDANDDLFTEIVRLRNTTIGADAFLDIGDRTTLTVNVNAIDEFRRGGNRLDLAPHQTDLTEQLEHRIVGGGLTIEHELADDAHRLSAYTSAQFTDRTSYYGGGGRVLAPGDSLTEDVVLAINASGRSQDKSIVTGAQYTGTIADRLGLVVGAEHIFSDVVDAMPGYDRTIDQRVQTVGGFVQADMTVWDRLTVVAGLRVDHVRIDGVYDLGAERFDNGQTLTVAVPRVSLKADLTDELVARASFAQGYRAPQAFDEDLHIETVGGAARFIRLDPGLITERSNSVTASLNYTRLWGRSQLNLLAEGFYTRLSDPFILSDPIERPSGVAVITKRNGDGARVQGVNLEASYALRSRVTAQLGLTAQSARFAEDEVLWTPEDPGDERGQTVTRDLLRTPNIYGFLTVNVTPSPQWDLSLSSVLTGPMDVPHVIDADDEYTIIERTPTFVELNLRVGYNIDFRRDFRVQVYAGMQNIANAYQADFDRGADRDAGYIYGPNRPRTLFIGLRAGLDRP